MSAAEPHGPAILSAYRRRPREAAPRPHGRDSRHQISARAERRQIVRSVAAFGITRGWHSEVAAATEESLLASIFDKRHFRQTQERFFDFLSAQDRRQSENQARGHVAQNDNPALSQQAAMLFQDAAIHHHE